MGLERAKFTHVGDTIWHEDSWRKVTNVNLDIARMGHGVVLTLEGLSGPVHYRAMHILRTKRDD